MTRLLEEKDNLLVLEFGDHVWIFHQNMISLKKENQVEDLDCWKKRGQWTWFWVWDGSSRSGYPAVSWEHRDNAWTVDWTVKLLQRWSRCVQRKETEKIFTWDEGRIFRAGHRDVLRESPELNCGGATGHK